MVALHTSRQTRPEPMEVQVDHFVSPVFDIMAELWYQHGQGLDAAILVAHKHGRRAWTRQRSLLGIVHHAQLGSRKETVINRQPIALGTFFQSLSTACMCAVCVIRTKARKSGSTLNSPSGPTVRCSLAHDTTSSATIRLCSANAGPPACCSSHMRPHNAPSRTVRPTAVELWGGLCALFHRQDGVTHCSYRRGVCSLFADAERAYRSKSSQARRAAQDGWMGCRISSEHVARHVL